MKVQLLKVTAFVDWDMARRNMRPPANRDVSELKSHAKKSLIRLRRDLANILSEVKFQQFAISFRLYHGWHRGMTATEDYRAIAALNTERVLGGRNGAIVFDPTILFGNELHCDGDRCKLFDTLRRRDSDGKIEQKMVDTALASDLLDYARRQKHDPNRAALVVGDDDDLLPPVITADKWGLKTWVARRRKDDSPHLKTRGLILKGRLD